MSLLDHPFDIRQIRGAFRIAVKATSAVFQEYVLKR